MVMKAVVVVVTVVVVIAATVMTAEVARLSLLPFTLMLFVVTVVAV